MELIHVSSLDNSLILTIKSKRICASCPCCRIVSSRPHSRYSRKVQDLPINDHPVQLLLLSHKWFCDNKDCQRSIFTERFDWLSTNCRRTKRTDTILRKIAFSTSCHSAEKVAHAAHIPVNHDTLLPICNRQVELNSFYKII
ncbi:transposase family protein [Niallia sp. HCP3S3_B10]|uniref:transposase family protein n=1 Tax=Niallia sp. HCP3S3_B10 TaxID=3438944 RepID=UPI003F8AC4E4